MTCFTSSPRVRRALDPARKALRGLGFSRWIVITLLFVPLCISASSCFKNARGDGTGTPLALPDTLSGSSGCDRVKRDFRRVRHCLISPRPS